MKLTGRKKARNLDKTKKEQRQAREELRKCRK